MRKEKQMRAMSQENNVQKKSNPKTIVIALAIICIILAASLVGVIALYQPNDSQAQLAEKDSTISSLQCTNCSSTKSVIQHSKCIYIRNANCLSKSTIVSFERYINSDEF